MKKHKKITFTITVTNNRYSYVEFKIEKGTTFSKLFEVQLRHLFKSCITNKNRYEATYFLGKTYGNFKISHEQLTVFMTGLVNLLSKADAYTIPSETKPETET